MIKVACHLGLGDLIAISPIIAKLATINYDMIIVIPCYEHNRVSVESIFVNFPNIQIDIVEDDSQFFDCTFRLGQYNTLIPIEQGEDFVSWFYRQASMSFDEISKYNPVPDAADAYEWNITSEAKYLVFVHDDQERGFKITEEGERPIKSSIVESILGYSEMIKRAIDIHCIDSSFFHLVNLLPTTGNLTYHRYVRKTESNNFKLIKNWKVLQ